MIIITKRKFNKILEHLESDSADSSKATDYEDFCWRCGNSNAVNYIRYKLGLKKLFGGK